MNDKNTENHWSKLLFLQTPLKSIIFHDVFLTESIIPWLFRLLQTSRFSLTFYKIPWLFPVLEKIFVFPWLFPDCGNPEVWTVPLIIIYVPQNSFVVYRHSFKKPWKCYAWTINGKWRYVYHNTALLQNGAYKHWKHYW